jgi:predicted NAD-dependent protein-ADP-ribosyltransferase YbiA (DUF1768 family)
MYYRQQKKKEGDDEDVILFRTHAVTFFSISNMSTKRTHTDADDDDVLRKSKKAKRSVETQTQPLVFFSRSADANARALSNFATSWLHIDARWYPSVEHVYQASKYPATWRYQFSCTERGGTPAIGLEARAAKSAGSKTGMKKRRVAMVPEFDGPAVMRAALAHKFALPEFVAVLRATGQRPLRHHGRRPAVWDCHTDHATGAIAKGENALGVMLEQLRAAL